MKFTPRTPLYLGLAALALLGGLVLSGPGTPPAGNASTSHPPASAQPPSAPLAFEHWLETSSSRTSDSRNLELGVRLARQRLADLQDLARRDPLRASASLLSLRQLAGLPPEIRRECEQPWSAVADLDLQWRTDPPAGPDQPLRCTHRFVVRSAGQPDLPAFGAHLRNPQQPLTGALLQGHRLGDLLLLDPSPLRPISPAERSAALDLLSSSPDPHPDSPLAFAGGKLLPFSSRAEIDSANRSLRLAVEQALRNPGQPVPQLLPALADGGASPSNPVLATPFMDDQLDVLFIRVDFSDSPGEANSISKAALESTLSTVASRISQFSYSTASLTYTVSNNLYRMPSTRASYAASGDNDGLITEARNLASAHYNLASYDVVAVYFPYVGGQISYGGLASVGGGNHWINGSNSVDVITHEFGHNFGLYHANYWNPSGSIGGDRLDPGGDSVEYGDVFDRMGSGGGANAYFNPYATHRLGWLPASKVVTATADGTWRIYRLDTANPLSHPTIALRVPMGNGVYYWVGHRRTPSTTSNLANAAYVVAEGLTPSQSNLIDMTPGSNGNANSDRADAGLPVGSFFYDSSSGVRFQTTASGGSAPNEWIEVNIQFDPRIEIATTNVQVDENAGLARVTLRRDFGGASVSSVDFATANGTATAGSDYLSVSGTLTWLPGDAPEKTIAVPIKPDNSNEGIETFTLQLSSPSGARIPAGSQSATVSILDPGRLFTHFTPPFFQLYVNEIVPLADGRVLVGGDFSDGVGSYSGAKNFARFLPDGSFDTSLLIGPGFNDEVFAIAVQPDGKILVGGAFTSYNGTACNRLVRLHADGSIDTSFLTQLGSGFNGIVRDIALDASNRILVAGSFTSFNGSSTGARCLTRLLATGARDTATPLSASLSSGDSINRIDAVQPLGDGRILIAGQFSSSYAGSPVDGFRSGIARLLSTGSRDTTFEPGAGLHFTSSRYSLGYGTCLKLQPDGKILVGGYFTAFNGTARNHLVRLNDNGSVDTTFTPPAFNSPIYSVDAQAGGHVLVAGGFSSPQPFLTRLQPNGASDTAWNPGGAPDGAIFDTCVGPDGSIWIGGNFFHYGTPFHAQVAKLAGGGGDAYDRWKITRFSAAQLAGADSLPGSDPDGDGLDNLLEMAIGTSPTATSYPPSLFTSRASEPNGGGHRYLEIEFTKSPDAAGLWLSGQFSNELGAGWLPANPSPGPTATYSVVSDTPTRLILRDNTPISSQPRRFGRFFISRPQ